MRRAAGGSEWRGAGLAGGLLAACLLAAGAAAADPARLLAVRLGGDASQTRLVLDLDGTATARPGGGRAKPGHVTIELAGVDAGDGMRGPARGLVTGWRVEGTGRGARLVLDLAAGAEIRKQFLMPPAEGTASFRYVVDVAMAAPPPPVQVAVRSPPVVVKPKIVVIDAGHGGHDPGAQGSGSEEKDITLAAAQALKERLERTDRYHVVMTRTSDVFIPLPERVQIARRAGADLFISLHADSAGSDPSRHGASIYTLSDSGGARVNIVLTPNERLAGAGGADPAVNGILLDLTQRSTRNRSADFAALLLDQISTKVDLLPRSQRDAGYFVLLAPDVPAVLLEMGFITCPQDAARLTDPVQRGGLMDSVASAIDAYFAKSARVAQQ